MSYLQELHSMHDLVSQLMIPILYVYKFFLSVQSLVRANKSESFAGGRRAVIWCESSSIPKKVKHVVGPSIFPGAKGMPVSDAAC